MPSGDALSTSWHENDLETVNIYGTAVNSENMYTILSYTITQYQ